MDDTAVFVDSRVYIGVVGEGRFGGYLQEEMFKRKSHF